MFVQFPFLWLLTSNLGEERNGCFSTNSLILFSPQTGILNQKMNKQPTAPSPPLHLAKTKHVLIYRGSGGDYWNIEKQKRSGEYRVGKICKGFNMQKIREIFLNMFNNYIFWYHYIHKRTSQTSTLKFLKLKQEIKRKRRNVLSSCPCSITNWWGCLGLVFSSSSFSWNAKTGLDQWLSLCDPYT